MKAKIITSIIILILIFLTAFIVKTYFPTIEEKIVRETEVINNTIYEEHIIYITEKVKETNLENKNYNLNKTQSKAKEWEERKGKQGSSYSNTPTSCARVHNRSLC